MNSSKPTGGDAAANNPGITRVFVASPSRHVQLSLVQVPGPSHNITAEPCLRISLNIGPRFTVDVFGPASPANPLGPSVRRSLDCTRHSLMLIPPDTEVTHHAGLPKPAGRAYVPVQLATFRISRELLHDCAMGLGLPAGQLQLEHQAMPTDELLRNAAQGLLADLRAGCPDGALASERSAAALLTRILFRLTPAGAAALTDVMAKVQAHVEEQLQNPLTLEELAAIAGMSVFHFCRVFRERLGATPHQYILSRRLLRAKRLLWSRPQATSRPASMVDIALACGFGSSSHFAAHFKRHTGQTPLQWQRQFPAGPD